MPRRYLVITAALIFVAALGAIALSLGVPMEDAEVGAIWAVHQTK